MPVHCCCPREYHESTTTMDLKGKERGILKLEPRARVPGTETRLELTPQGSCERSAASPQPSVDRLSVTWADPEPYSSMAAVTSELRDGSEDEDYSASLSAVLRQRRASVRRSRKGRARRPSSPFLPDDTRARRRSSVFTTSSCDTAISMEENQPGVVSQEQIFENIHLHKEVLSSVKQQPLGMRRKLKLVHQAKTYVKRHEGQLQERLAQSKSTRDIYARFNILLNTRWQQMKREAANTSNLLIPWELRIKEIESHFGSVVASYFTFLRWLFWVNLVIAFILLVFVIVPEYLTANPEQDGERKIIMKEERQNASNLLTLWEFEGVLKFSPIFYGYYSNVERPEYRMPLAYFLTGLVVYIYSFVAILRKMAENSRMSKLSEKEDECIFSWKLFTGWDFMIGNTETAHNRIASVILGFKEALLEEAEKKKDVRNWRIISLRGLVNVCVVILLVVSAYAVVTVVTRSDDTSKPKSWWRDNETTIVVTVISIAFPQFFELLGFLEHYHPRKQLRLQLARIMLLNLLNLYSLIFALFSKIEGMSKALDNLKPTLSMNASTLPNTTLLINASLALNEPLSCYEDPIDCAPCNIHMTASDSTTAQTTTVIPLKMLTAKSITTTKTKYPSGNPTLIDIVTQTPYTIAKSKEKLLPENLIQRTEYSDTSTEDPGLIELKKIRTRFKTDSENATDSGEDDSGEVIFTDDELNNETLNNTETTQSTWTADTISLSISTNDYTSTGSIQTDDISTTEDIIESTTSFINTDSTYHIESESTSSYTREYDAMISTDTTVDGTTFTSIETGEGVNIETTIENNFTETPFVTEIFLSYTSTLSPKASEDNSDVTMASIESTRKTGTSKFEKDYTHSTNIDLSSDTTVTSETTTTCPNISFNCTINCQGKNVTQVYFITNCHLVEKKCYTRVCRDQPRQTNITEVDIVYTDKYQRKMYNLTIHTKKKLLKLCWETMFGQELVKLTMMDLVFVLLGTLFLDFFRALFVRYMNRCWFWDLEKKYPSYGDFKIAENILHLINNQGMVWMGMFFSPGLVVLNVVKLMIMMYLRSWAVMTCNVPHEVVFRVSKSNNFYLALLLTMLFLCVLPVGYTIVWVKPSWHCGPFSEYDKIYYILTNNIYKILPKSLNFTLEYIASPAIVIPLLVLLILIIYYLTSLTNSLREANNDLKIQLRRERTEERRKMFQLADTRRRGGSSAMDQTPFARWKKALPALPLHKSIDSDDRKTNSGEDNCAPVRAAPKKGKIFAKIVGLALDKKTEEVVSDDVPLSPSPNNVTDETDSEFHEALPKEVLKLKDISVIKVDNKRKNNVEFKTEVEEAKQKDNLNVKPDKDERFERRPVAKDVPPIAEDTADQERGDRTLQRRQSTDSDACVLLHSDFGAVIPVITISTTESDDEVLHPKRGIDNRNDHETKKNGNKSRKSKNGETKSLKRQSSVDSNDQNMSKDKEKQDSVD